MTFPEMATTTTRLMILSDTHNFQFGNAERYDGEFVQPTSKCDVLLHCGDLTMTGGITDYKKCIQMLGSIDAELKLVIAGNHDRDLDPNWDQHPDEFDQEVQDGHEEAVALWKGPIAKAAGITYLEEGLNTFELKNGSKFTIYTSPYQPEFCNWAFPYERDEDRFNPEDKVTTGMKCIAENPIPDFPDVDIVMTHGPPKDILDWTPRENVGCESLLRAVSRARPKLYCFGHIHEAYGMEMISWKEDKSLIGQAAYKSKVAHKNEYPEPSILPIKHGEETLMVNAAIMNMNYRPVNSPWVLDIELPRV
jgi:hypothetical protein